MPVDSLHPAYKKLLPKIRKIRTAVAGQDDVKERGADLLPFPAPNTGKGKKRNQTYLQRAVFENITGRTVEGLVARCFAVDPVQSAPDGFKYILEDIDGSGVTATQQAKQALETVVQFSRGGLFVDYPTVEAPASKEDEVKNGIRPRIILIDPENITNWRTTARNGKTVLSLVVIRESYEVPGTDDGFIAECKTRFRVLKLTKQGESMVYVQEIHEQTAEASGYAVTQTFIPTTGKNQPWDEIPFLFLGAAANDPVVEKPLMDDITDLNFAHYRNSADYEDNVFRTGQPQAWASGLTLEYLEEVYPSKTIEFGSTSIVLLPEGGAFGIAQVQPNTPAREAMDKKVESMIALGAKIIEPKKVDKTATESGYDEADTTSVLATAAKNVTAGYTWALVRAAIFADVELPENNEDGEALSLELNTDFAIARMSAADRSQLLSEWQAGGITDEEYRANLCKSGVGYMSFEKWTAAQDAADAKLLGMGFTPPGKQPLKLPPGQPGKEDAPAPAPPNPAAKA